MSSLERPNYPVPQKEFTTPFTEVIRREIPGKPRNALLQYLFGPAKPQVVEHKSPTLHYYEASMVRPYTTTSGQLMYLPDVMYRAYFFDKNSSGDDVSADFLPRGMLTFQQSVAISLAHELERKRQREDPTRSVFSHLRRLEIDENGLMFVAAPEQGKGPDRLQKYAAIKTAKPLAVVDFATIHDPRANRKEFAYDQADVDAFVPPLIAEEANSYAFVDQARNVATADGMNIEAQIGRIMLFTTETDMSFPIDNIRLPY